MPTFLWSLLPKINLLAILDFVGEHPIELHEHQVPDLDHAGVAGIDQRPARKVRREIVVNLAARAARAGLAHLPEVVLLVAQVDVRGVDVGHGAPDLGRLVVGGQALGRVALEHRRVQALAGQAPNLGQQLPRPGDGLALEVVAEAPVAQHLEERVVIGVVAHVFQVVVLSAGADALLAVGGPVVRAGLAPQEDVLELVHAGVGEQQRRILRGQQRTGGDRRVAALNEKVDELATDFLAGLFHSAFPRRPVFRNPKAGAFIVVQF